MKNSIYYLLLIIISTFIFTYTLWKKRDRKLIALYFFTAGLTYFLEYIALVLLNSYAYHPEVLRVVYFDNIAGAIVSDAFTIPMTAIFIAAFGLRYIFIFFISLVITGIEVLFVQLGIYEQHWWRYFHTFIGANAFFLFSKKWFSKLQMSLKPLSRYFILLSTGLFIHASIAFVLAAILGKYFYQVGWFSDPNRGHIAFATLYLLAMNIFFSALIALRLHWLWISLGALLPTITDLFLLRTGILTLSNQWSLSHFLVLRILLIFALLMFNKYLLKERYI